jgi:hypothetical protein
MITNEQYLIQKYAEAREKQTEYVSSDAGRLYWKGVMDTYHSLLTESFSAWAEYGSVGYFVFYEMMTYDSALSKAKPISSRLEREDPEERHWKNVATYNERHSQPEDDFDYDY